MTTDDGLDRVGRASSEHGEENQEDFVIDVEGVKVFVILTFEPRAHKVTKQQGFVTRTRLPSLPVLGGWGFFFNLQFKNVTGVPSHGKIFNTR